jgi:phosphatidylglycerol---prolipoprotein diacylglyceryl transferase
MHPILFTLPGGFPVRSFGVLLAIGFLVGSWVFSRLVARHSTDPERDVQRYSAVPVWVLIGIVIGARLMYVVVEVLKGSHTGSEFLSKPWTILMVWQGGLVMYGGLFGGLLGGWMCARRHKIPIWHGTDIGLTAGWVGLSIGRIGCLLVGDDYGKVVPERYRHLPFPITLTVPDPLPPHSLFDVNDKGQVLWATQPWMSLNALLIALFGVWLLKRRRYPGQVALSIVLIYSITRFGIENFRGDAVRGTWFGGSLSTSQIVAMATGSAALILLLRFFRLRVPPPPGVV